MDKYRDVLDQIPGFAERNPDIETVVVVGSQSRKKKPADEYSDLDLILFSTDPGKYISDDHWLRLFGEVVCTFTETTVGGYTERRVLFSDNRDIDFPILPSFVECSDKILGDSRILSIFAKGYRVIYDRTETAGQKIRDAIHGRQSRKTTTTRDNLENLTNDFNYHLVWATKKLKRGEIWTAVSCVNNYLTNRLLQMLKYSLRSEEAAEWHHSRFIEEHITHEILDELRGCFCKYDEQDVKLSIHNLSVLFNRLAKGVFEKFRYPFNEKQSVDIQILVETLM